LSRAIASALAALVLLASALPAAASDPEATPSASSGEIVPGEVIVKPRGGQAGAEIAARHGLAVGSAGETAARALPIRLSTRGRAVAEVLADLRADAAVEYAEPSYLVQLADDGAVTAVAVNDPKTAGQYSLDRMRVRDAWGLETGGSGIVAVLDTGVQYAHRDLVGRLLPGRDFVNDDTNAGDDNGHGTWVAGIIAANANDGYGIAGISWSDKVLPVKIMSREGTGSTADLIDGIVWAADHGATVINMSVGGFPYSQAVQDAVNYAWNSGAVLVGAAGNNRRQEDFYPASFANVVSVSATQVEDEFSHWSSWGPKVDVSAPGSSVQTTNCTTCTYADHDTWGDHTYISGTSFATPNVAGVVALIRARYPAATPAEVVSRLVAGVDDLGYAGWDNRYGRGRVNALRSLGGTASSPGPSAGDAMEPNNTLAAARPIAIGSSITPTLHPAGDVDTFAVDVPRMGRLDVRVTGVTDSRDYPWNRSTLPIDPIVELYTTGGTLLKRVDNEWESGVELASINLASATRIIVRVSNYYANGNRTAYSVRATFVDEVPPRVLGLSPAPGSTMVPPTKVVTFSFSEPVNGVDASSVTLRTAAGTRLTATVSYDRSTGAVRVVPAMPLPSNTSVRLGLSSSIVDSVGLPLTATSYAFSTMPGQTYAPARRVSFATGTHVGHQFGVGGAVLRLKSATLARPSGASTPQRATFGNLPGAWLYVENGIWAGTWIRESGRAHIGGTTQIAALPPTTRVTFRAGTHVGRKYDATGAVIASRSLTITRASGANADAVATINGVRHHRITNGLWAGYWIAESTAAYRPGIIDRLSLSPARRIRLGAGSHTGFTFSSTGVRIGSKSATLAAASGADVSAWAIVNGRAHVLVVNGIWAGYWLPEGDVLAYER
jgi:subtilisin family serine protease